MTRAFASLILLTALAAPVFASEFSSLEERMSAREFKEAGLDTLSSEQLAKLNEWLRTHGTQDTGGFGASLTAPSAPEDRRGLYDDDQQDDSTVVSRIAGEFRGWHGEGQRFELENGQVWVSTDPNASFTVKLRDPSVRIEHGLLKAWYLKVEGYNSSVRVKRIK